MSDKEIHWNQAIQDQKDFEKAIEQEKIDYDANLQLAIEDSYRAMSSPNFHSGHISDLATLYGVDEEDLIFGMI